MVRLNKFLLGADPEFMMMQGADTLWRAAYRALPHPSAGTVGIDHGGWVSELRPAPALYALTLIRRMRRLLGLPELVKQPGWAGKWRAGGGLPVVREGGPLIFQAIGGHVHFGLPEFSREQRAALDNWNGYLLGRDILPKAENAKRMTYTHYGTTNDAVRVCGEHVEYRGFPSWLFHPKTAMLVLTGAKLAAALPGRAPDAAAGVADLKRYFAELQDHDADAAFVYETILEPATRWAHLQHDVDADIREAWQIGQRGV